MTPRLPSRLQRVRFTTAGVLCVLFALLNASSALAANKPRVASINSCTDQLALTLADPEQILSLTYLSHERSASVLRDKAISFPTNTAHAEEILALAPDLVLAGAYTSKYTIQLLRDAGVRVETINIASSIDDVMNNILMVGEWLDQSDTATAIVDNLKTRISLLPDVPKQRPRAAIFDPNGYTVGANTMRGQILELSGWHNAATDRGVQYYGTLALESLLKLNPDILVASPYSADTWSRAQALSRHPALQQSGINADVVNIPSAKTICAGPWTIGVIEELAQVRLNYQQPVGEEQK